MTWKLLLDLAFGAGLFFVTYTVFIPALLTIGYFAVVIALAILTPTLSVLALVARHPQIGEFLDQ